MAERTGQQTGQQPDVRFFLANERTFLAWQRTALGMLGAGVAVLHLFVRDAAVWLLGTVLLVAGGCCAVLGWWRYRDAERAIERGERIGALVMAPVLAGALVVAVVAALASALL
ncbi:YidH family protein [Nocardioides jiangxiensis]|uniref:DUF202 domain-containing protein n=1 Tax=Nocardioides jiangxiensis TaxID=3064524 RepID=A0ABT9B374_9ACTN|nr:DUF202 domain-containing protein [Nocardioides sp. WY-20]MDO7868830.1 DUF202 domain-containing protein [Nocardioides sp. WY-20]